jgi:hypothetical protein
MTPPTLVIDVDSTLYPFLTALAKANDIKIPLHHITTWDALATVVERAGVPFGRACEKAWDLRPAMLPPFPGAVRAMRHLHETGVQIHILTHRKPFRFQQTRDWLEHWGVPYHTLVVDGEQDKLAYAQEHQAIAIIDDKPDLLTEVALNGTLTAMTLAWPWNHKVLRAYPQIIGAGHWDEFVPHLLALQDTHGKQATA